MEPRLTVFQLQVLDGEVDDRWVLLHVEVVLRESGEVEDEIPATAKKIAEAGSQPKICTKKPRQIHDRNICIPQLSLWRCTVDNIITESSTSLAAFF